MNLILTGSNGSIGSALQKHFSSNGWNVINWDIRKNEFPNRADALILAHGGDGDEQKEIFEKNALSVGSVLDKIPRLVKDDGCVIVLTSRRAIRPTIEEWDYAAAKSAAHAYSKMLYKAFPKLRVTSIAPGWVESNMAQRGNAQSVIPVKELCQLILLCVMSKGMRIPEIFIEPIGDAEY